MKRKKVRDGYIKMFSELSEKFPNYGDPIYFTTINNQQELALFSVLKLSLNGYGFQIPDVKNYYKEHVDRHVQDYDDKKMYRKIFENKRWWPDFIQKLKMKNILEPTGVKLGKQTYRVKNSNWWIKVTPKRTVKKIRPDVDKITSLQGCAIYETMLSMKTDDYISVNRIYRRLPSNTLTKKQIGNKISCFASDERPGVYCLRRLITDRRPGEPQRYELFDRDIEYIPMTKDRWEKLNRAYMEHYDQHLTEWVKDYQKPDVEKKIPERQSPRQKRLLEPEGENRMKFKELQEAGVLMDTIDIGNCINDAINDLKRRLEEALFELEMANDDLKEMESLKIENQNLRLENQKQAEDICRYKEKFENIRINHGSSVFDPSSL